MAGTFLRVLFADLLMAASYVLVFLWLGACAEASPRRPPGNGSCGAAANVAVTTAPTANLCSAGTASTVSGAVRGHGVAPAAMAGPRRPARRRSRLCAACERRVRHRERSDADQHRADQPIFAAPARRRLSAAAALVLELRRQQWRRTAPAQLPSAPTGSGGSQRPAVGRS